MYKQDLDTASGMWALWDYDTYKNVNSYEEWEPLFCEDQDIEKQISKHAFVPINICEDGCYAFAVKVNEPLSDREEKYLCVKSEEYLFHSNGKAIVSGIDHIESSISEKHCICLDLPEGYYSVVVCLISWDEEPNAYLPDGSISPDALSDFVVLINTESNIEGKKYGYRVETFEADR